MEKIIYFLNKIRCKVNKYHITVVVFLVITFFVGNNTLLDGIRYDAKIKSVRKDVENLKKENEEMLNQLSALQGDREDLEKFAREQFLMTKDNEELFLIVE